MTTTQTQIESPKFSAFNAEKQQSYILPLNPKAEPNSGFRIAEIRFRVTEKDKITKAAKMCEIPLINNVVESLVQPEIDPLNISQERANVIQVLREAIEEQQDNYIRAAIELGKQSVLWNQISCEAMLAELCAESVSKRLTKEAIELWFNNHALNKVTDRALEICITKQLDPDNELGKKQIATTINNYKSTMMKLAATIPGLNEREATALQAMLTNIAANDPVAMAMSKKVATMLGKDDSEL